MTIAEFHNYFYSLQKNVDDLVRRQLPVKIGVLAKSFFTEGFRNGGFDRGASPWKPTKRQMGGSKSAASNYGPLLSKNDHLMLSIYYLPGDAYVRIGNNVPYAAIHNDGGTVHPHPTVTPKMRKMAWYRYFNAGGGKKDAAPSPEALMWKRLALTKKEKLSPTVNIPRRHFLGDSPMLTQEIRGKIESELSNILIKK